MLVSVKDTRWRGQGRSDEAEPPSCHPRCPLLMLLNEETQLCNTITGMLSTKKNRCFICSAQNTNGNVCLSAAVLPWQIWNYAVTNTKWLLSTNPCKQIGRNPMDKLGGGASGQTGGAARYALASTRNDCSKFRHCPGLVHMLQNPIMYDTWGGASNIFSARSLWRKIPRSQGLRSPDPLPKWVGEPD